VITGGIVSREFIGRTRERDFLVERALTIGPGRGASIVVKGAAGIGKSRLIREVVTMCAARGRRAVVVSCAEFGDAPYAPIIALTDALGMPELGALLRAEGDAGRNARSERNRRFAESAAAFAAAARTTPYVAIVEDVHWADRASLELFRHLIGELRNQPIALIATERDDEQDDAATLRLLDAIEHDADSLLTLGPLTANEIGALISAALRVDGRRLSSVVIDEIVTLSDGRPFHVEELLRSVLDRDAPPSNPASLVPRSLRAAVRERLAGFSDAERRVLAYAAVIGRRFSLALLSELLGSAGEPVLLALRKARDAQLIVEGEDDETFSFRHALIREIVYGEMLRTETRPLHLRLAMLLIERAPEDELAAIAYHAWCSGDAALSQLWNTRAGDRSSSVFAHIAAITHYERAYAAARGSDDRATLAARVAAASFAAGEMPDAAHWYGVAAEDARGAADPDDTYRYQLWRATSLYEGGSFDRAIDAAVAVTRALGTREDALRFRAETTAGSMLMGVGRSEEALRYLRAAAALDLTPEPFWAARHSGNLAYVLYALGAVDESMEAFRRAESEARALGDLDLLTGTQYNFALVRLQQGETREAAAILQSGLEIARGAHLVRRVAWQLEALVNVHVVLGDFERARELYREATTVDHGIAAARLWLAGSAARLGTLAGDDRLVAQGGIETIVHEALANGSDHTVASIAGAFLLWQQAHGIAHDAALLERLVSRVERAEAGWDVNWFAQAAAAFPPAFGKRARAALALAATHPAGRVARANLLLFDARLATRERRRNEADDLARRALDEFRFFGWPVEEAYARELRGGVKDAVEIFRRIGAAAEVQRLTTLEQHVPRRRGETTLTAREREIAAHIAAGRSNRDVAEILVISERTVETHVASIYNKLGIESRKELAALYRAEG